MLKINEDGSGEMIKRFTRECASLKFSWADLHMTGTRPLSILYIEDNEVALRLIEFILDRRGNLQLLTARNGQSGIEKAQETMPDLILLDISLPDMNGYAVLEALRSNPATAKIPVIAISGEFPPKIPQGTTCVFDRYLPKPIEVIPLYKAIDELMPS
jgi:CheY-like chemotaxis protein